MLHQRMRSKDCAYRSHPIHYKHKYITLTTADPDADAMTKPLVSIDRFRIACWMGTGKCTQREP